MIDTAYQNLPSVKQQLNNISISHTRLFDMEEMLNLSYDEKHFSQLCQQQTFHKLSYKRIHFLLTTEGQPTLYKKLVAHSS